MAAISSIRRPNPVGSTGRHELAAGAAAMLPLLLGYAPFALIVGAAAAEFSNPTAGWAGIWAIFAGSTQLAVMQLTDAGTALPVVIATGLVINARLVVYSTAFGARWHAESRLFRIVAAAAVIDPTWAVAMARYERPESDADTRTFFVGTAITLWFGWAALVTTGMVAGAVIPPDLGVEVVIPVCLAALAAPALSTRAGWATVGVAATAALFAGMLPAGTGFLAAVVAGTVAGSLLEGHET